MSQGNYYVQVDKCSIIYGTCTLEGIKWMKGLLSDSRLALATPVPVVPDA